MSVLYPRASDTKILIDFFSAVTDFGYSSFYTMDQGSWTPHPLQVVTSEKNGYFNRLFLYGSGVLRRSYQESGSHDIQQMVEDAFNGKYNKLPYYEWTNLYPIVEQAISAHGPETKAAFETLFDSCKLYEYKADTIIVPSGGRSNARLIDERHSLSDDEAAKLVAAMEKIWEAYPETDPRLIEGTEYVLSSSPMHELFEGKFSRFYWTRNEHRSDYQIDKKIEEALNGRKFVPDYIASLPATAAQSAENLEQLKPYREQIAVNVIDWALINIIHYGAGELTAENGFQQGAPSQALAREILNGVDDGTKTPQQIAVDLGKGRYGSLYGNRKWLHDDEDRKRALQSAAAMPELLKLVADVRSGVWFNREKDNLMSWSERAQAIVPATPEMALTL